jgi:hypothetical protein
VGCGNEECVRECGESVKSVKLGLRSVFECCVLGLRSK